MKILINPVLGQSFVVQARLIEKLLREKGHDVEMRNIISVRDVRDPSNDAFLWICLVALRTMHNVGPAYLSTSKPKAIYGTIEGFPHQSNIVCSPLPQLKFIAVSEFVAKCLREVGLRVQDVIHHAVDAEICKEAAREPSVFKEKFSEKFGDKVKFIYVGRDDPRKNLGALNTAVEILNAKGVDDYVVLLHTDKSAMRIFSQDNVFFVGDFGDDRHDTLLRKIAACDYLVFPSVSEGFGLPVLEANAVGVPAVHCWFPPLSEFSSKDFNFVFSFTERRLVQNENVQYWVFHDYPAHYLAETMEMAIDYRLNKTKKYKEFSKAAMEHALKFDYHRQYGRLVRYLGVE